MMKKLQCALGFVFFLFLAGCTATESNLDLVYFNDANFVVEFLNANHTRSSIDALGFEITNLGAYDRVIANPEFEEWRAQGTTWGANGFYQTSLVMTNNEPRTIRVVNRGNPLIQQAMAPASIREDYFSEVRFHYDGSLADFWDLVSVELLDVYDFHGIDWRSLSTWELGDRTRAIDILDRVYHITAEYAPQGMPRSIVFEVENILFQVRTQENMPATIIAHILEETRAEREARIAARLSRQLGVSAERILELANRAPDLNGTYRNVNITSRETHDLGDGIQVEIFDLYLSLGMEFPRMLIYSRDDDAYPFAVVFQSFQSASAAQNGRNHTLQQGLLERVWNGAIEDAYQWLFVYAQTQLVGATSAGGITFFYMATPDITTEMVEGWLALTLAL